MSRRSTPALGKAAADDAATATRALLGEVDAGRYRSPAARKKRRKSGAASEAEARAVDPGYDPSRFAKPSVTADVLILTPDVTAKQLRILLIERKGRPYRGFHAFPGGFVDMHEEIATTARRELEEETNLGKAALARTPLYEVGTAGTPGRDPRDRVITVVHLALVPPKALKRADLQAGDDAAAVGLFPVEGPQRPPLAFDHAGILDDALAWLRWHTLHTAVLQPLLPAHFPFAALKETMEIVLGQPLDGRVLRQVLLARGVIESHAATAGNSRRAEYRFTNVAVPWAF